MAKPVIQYYKSTDKQFTIVCGHGISKSFPVHRHLSYSVGLIINGFRILKIRGQKYIMGKGDIFILNTEEPHAVGENNSPEHDYIVVSIMKKAMDQYFHSSAIRFKNIIEDELISEFLTTWFNELIEVKPKHDYNLPGLLELLSPYQILVSEPESENEAVVKIKAILDNDPVSNHSLDSLADKAFLSPFHFSRLFKRQTGMAPHQYLLDNRLRQARDLLENNFSVIDIAIACGFYDASHFIRHFTGYYGVSPLEYQKGIKPL